jgi:hypothetical protein
MNKPKDEAAGLGRSEIELPRWARQKALAKVHYEQSAESDRDSADQDYVPGAESEEESNDEESDSSNPTEASESEDDLFDTTNLNQSLKSLLMVKFNTRESWNDFADRHQPEDNTRHLMALLQLPEGKKWSMRLWRSQNIFTLVCFCSTTTAVASKPCTMVLHPHKHLGIPTSVRGIENGPTSRHGELTS